MTTTTLELKTGVQAKARAFRNLENIILGVVGLALIWQNGINHHLSIPAETIILVVFLSGLMGITRIPLPTHVFGRKIGTLWYPLLCGIISGFMDSFLVLLLLCAADVKGSARDQMKFKVYCMLAALIGGLITYFGEVYMLPLALKYEMQSWYSMLPIVPPVLVFLTLLCWLAGRLDVEVVGVGKSYQTETIAHGTLRKIGGNWQDYIEFTVMIALLLYAHNAVLCLGLLLLYTAISGQGVQLLHVVTAEMEIAVMLLLFLALLIAGPAAPYIAQLEGWWAVIPATINAVLTGAIYPASGNVWSDVQILSFAALLTPISSLVGVMLFKTKEEWGQYIVIAVPLALVWLVVYSAWMWGPWEMISPYYAEIFGEPRLLTVLSESAH